MVADWINRGRQFYLFPLQLDSDAQIRSHSPFGRMWPGIESVLESFARHAPSDRNLLIKNHPLDNAWINYRRRISKLVRALDLGDRVGFIEGGSIDTLIDSARGIVVLNSTVGLTAASRGRPVICLSPAIFDLEGMTTQSPLSTFWLDPPPPDAGLLRNYLDVVTANRSGQRRFLYRGWYRSGHRGQHRPLESDHDPLASAPTRSKTMEDYRKRAAG